VTLRLASPDRYQAEAADPLGRAVWGLDVEGDHGLWLDHRGRAYCRLTGALDLAFLPLGPLSLSALPPLLLGRLPVAPAGPASPAAGAGGPGAAGEPAEGVAMGSTATSGGATGGGAAAGSTRLSYRDATGRRWGAVVRHGVVLSWALWQDEAAGPILSWVSSGGWAVLSDRRKGVQVRWREALREPLLQPALVPMSPPADYREVQCIKPPRP
jgi:hypothetical protein